MNIVVDANILISSCINPAGVLPKIIIFNNHKADFITPEYALEEMKLNKEAVCHTAGITPLQFNAAFNLLIPYFLIIKNSEMNSEVVQYAKELAGSIDNKDVIYVALTLALDALLWAGDLKLYRGLRRKGFQQIVTTSDLQKIINGI